MSDENRIDRSPMLIAFVACGLSGAIVGFAIAVVLLEVLL